MSEPPKAVQTGMFQSAAWGAKVTGWAGVAAEAEDDEGEDEQDGQRRDGRLETRR